jgi:hypothetical protein
LHSGFIRSMAFLPLPSSPPSTLCGSSTIRMGRVARIRSMGFSPPVFSLGRYITFFDFSRRATSSASSVCACCSSPNLLMAPTVITMIWICGLVAKLRTWPSFAES